MLSTLKEATLVSHPDSPKRVLGPLTSLELSMLDNSFTTYQNDPPFVLSGELLPMPQPGAFTAGDGTVGDRRNELFIVGTPYWISLNSY